MAEEPTRTKQRMTLVATGLGLFMIFLDATIVNVALPDIQSHFDVGEAGIQWVVAAYSLTMGMFMMSAATLSDTRGRRRAYLIGIVVFCVASVGCGLAPDLAVLNVSRGVQGVGAAIVNVASLALVSAAYPDPSAKAKAIGLWTGIAAVGLAVGPTLGGVLTDGLGWRSIFLVNAIVGAAAIVLTVAFVSESRDPTERSIDLPGQLLFIGGIGALTYGLIEGPQKGWGSPLIAGLLVGSVVLGVVFVRAELHSRDPMMDVRVFRDRVYSVALITIFAMLFCVYGMMLVITQYFQNVHEYSAEKAGFLMLAMTVPTVILSPVAGRLAARVGGRRPTLTGASLMVAGFTVLIAGLGGSILVILVGLALAGSAAAMSVAPATGVAMSSVPAERSGMASGIMSAQRALGSTAGFAIMGTLLALVLAAELPNKFEPYIPDPTTRSEVVDQVVDDATPQAVAALIAPGKPLSNDVGEEPELISAADDAFVDGMRVALVSGLVLAVGALVAGYVVFPHGLAPMEGAEVGEAVGLDVEEAERSEDEDLA